MRQLIKSECVGVKLEGPHTAEASLQEQAVYDNHCGERLPADAPQYVYHQGTVYALSESADQYMW